MIIDFHIWTECYATMSAILAVQQPKPLNYSRTSGPFTRASRNFDSSVWASYDMAFRRRVANWDGTLQ